MLRHHHAARGERRALRCEQRGADHAASVATLDGRSPGDGRSGRPRRPPSPGTTARVRRRLLVVVLVPGGTIANHAHHRRIVHIENPAQRVHPRLLGLGLHLRPVTPRERGHEGGIDGALIWLVEEDPDLLPGAADADLTPETEAGVARIVLDLGMLAEVLEDLV